MPIKMSKIEGSLRLVLAYYEDFNRHDAAAMARHLSAGCLLEPGGPLPDGQQVVGREAIHDHWAAYFAAVPGARLQVEEAFGLGYRVIARWTLQEGEGVETAVRGADIFRVTSGAIAEQFSYRKGVGAVG